MKSILDFYGLGEPQQYSLKPSANLFDTYGVTGQTMPGGGDGDVYTTASLMPGIEQEAAYRASIPGRIANWLASKRPDLNMQGGGATIFGKGLQAIGLDASGDRANTSMGQAVNNTLEAFKPSNLLHGGAETANHWLGASQYPEQLTSVDVLAPLGLSAMAAPFMPRGAVGSAGGKLASGALDMSHEARMQRAREMGFDNPWWRGDSSDFNEFDAAYMGTKHGTAEEPDAIGVSGFDFTRSKPLAEWHADGGVTRNFLVKEFDKDGSPRVFALDDLVLFEPDISERLSRLGIKIDDKTTFADVIRMTGGGDSAREALMSSGVAGVYHNMDKGYANGDTSSVRIFDPRNIRSVNAAFDPAKADSANLLAADQARASLPGTVVNALEDGQRGAFGNGFAPLENLPAFNYELPGGVRVSRYNNNYEFFDGDNKIGNAYVRDLGDRVQVGKIGLDEPYQRRGIGNAFYDQLGDEYRKTVVPDDTLSPAAYEFWNKRDPDAVAGHVQRGNNYYRGFEELGPEPAALPARTERNANLLDQLKALDELLSGIGRGP